MITSSVQITPYTRRHRRELLSLVHFQSHVHLHLDWRSVDEWIDEPDVPILLAFDGQTLVGAMAASSPISDTVWLRLAAIHDYANIELVLVELWKALRIRLVELGVRDVGVLVLRPWIAPNLSPLGFTFTEDIVTLRRRGANHPEPLRTDVTIRTAYLEEVPQILKIDQVAFEPIWQMTLLTLRQAARMSSSFTVAEVDGKMVGYQLSTLHNDGAHLARLAVLPDVQGGGIGGALLGDLIGRFVRRNILTLTVNTQATNIRSQNLYRRYGFDPTGLDIPYWHLSI